MKQNLLFLLLLLALCGHLNAKTIYVKHDAGGDNSGTSWQNAFTNLDDALLDAGAGDQLWVAAGTYKPLTTSFLVEAGVELYGGFNGTEMTLSARDVAANLTILSGDILGDDVAGVFNQKRGDNAMHVLEIVPGISPSDRAVVDGFTIKGGQTLVGASNPDESRRGGGILTTAIATIRNCRFTDNYADAGGALAALGLPASGLLVDNCIFEKNGTALLSSGIYIRDLQNGGEINKCTFRDNTTIRGCLYMLTSADMVIDSCLFEKNTAGTNPCAALYNFQTTFSMTNTIFRQNTAVDYGAMYNDGRDGIFPFVIDNCLFEDNAATDTQTGATAVAGAVFHSMSTGLITNTIFRNNVAEYAGAMYLNGHAPDNNIIIDNCLFDGNQATVSRGGGIYSFKADYELKNSTLTGGNAAVSGSAIHNADSTTFYVHDCLFELGTASFGGAVSNYSAGDRGAYENCTFKNNSAGTSGGAITTGFTAQVGVENCTFENNGARFGGAMFVQNSESKLTVRKSIISGNNAEVRGGGINISGGISLTVEDTRLELNESDEGGGIAIADDTFNLGKTILRNTILLSNFALTQGAGLYVVDTEVNLENCLFVANQNFGTGAGGAINNNCSGAGSPIIETSPITAVNCTFADNTAEIGAGIAQWQDSTGTASLSLQNCVLYNTGGVNYEIEAGAPTVVSMGGNLSSDQSLLAVLTNTNDQNEADPLFVDAANLDYHLLPGSPCIDKGIATGAPATDLDGNPRSGAPDQGCYEFQTVGTHLPGALALPLRLMPNPVIDRTIMVIENDWTGEFQINVYSQNGALVRTLNAAKTAKRWVQVLEVQDLPAGRYQVNAQLGTQVFEGSLVKN